tara:strand:+ start:41 stop:409 length:369 start_codon:yes stop_codon:yes gene_type:complete
MGRIVYSFSLPEESEAVWLLKKYKREGKVLSHIIQNALEYGSKEQIELQRDHDWEERNRRRAEAVLKDVFGVYSEDFNFYEKGHPRENQLLPGVNQPIEVLKQAKRTLQSRSEWIIKGGWDE